MALKYRDLKIANFKQGSNDNIFERYIIEDISDLNKFFKVIDTPKTMQSNLINSFNEGYKIILTDAHPRSGFPTYCFESEYKEDMHPSSIYRV